MPAFVHTKIPAQGYKFLRHPAPALDPSGFDTASARVFFRGGMSDFLAKFKLGALASASGYNAAPAGSVLYCLGPQGQPEISYGHIEADIAWKGIVSPRGNVSGITSQNPNDTVLGMSQSLATTEVAFPLQRGNNTLLHPHPAKIGTEKWVRMETVQGPLGGTIITALVPWRIRRIARTYAMSLKGISMGGRNDILHPPLINGNTPGGGVDWSVYPDPLITVAEGNSGTSAAFADGWVCRNYQRQSEYAVGDKVLAFWTADYEWIERYGA